MGTRLAVVADVVALCELLNNDRLVGQPVVTPETLHRNPPVDTWCHDQLGAVTVLIHEHRGELQAAVAYADTNHGVRDILWTAGEHHPEALGRCLASALSMWSGPVRAWSYAPAHTAGLEGLAVGHYPNTANLLEALGFTGDNMWSYQLLQGSPNSTQCAELWGTHKQVVYDAAGEPVAEWEVALVGTDPVCVGAVWWLECYKHARGRGYGRAALDEALAQLRSLGAQDVILYVDDSYGARPERVAAMNLYRSAGFVEVGRLWSFHRGDIPPDPEI